MVVLMIIVVIVLSSIFDLGEKLFGLTPSNINVKIATIKNVSITLLPSLPEPSGAVFDGIKIGTYIDDLSELRPDGSIVFPGAREWYDYWSYASRKGRSHLVADDDNTHIHDNYVISAVESVSEASMQHISDMKTRYESVGALADFYARGLGWIIDVSSR